MTKHQVVRALEDAGIAYQAEQPELKRKTVAVIDDPTTDVQCYIRKQGDRLSIAFRGSDKKQDWITNFRFWKKKIPYGNTKSDIRVHTGFITAYNCPNVRGKIHALITDEIRSVMICGHSYGAALTVLCAVDLQYNFPKKDYESYLFGCPRVGNAAFRESYNKRVFKTLRVENGNDIVTKVPLMVMGYRHVGIRLAIGPPRVFGKISFCQHYPQSYYSNWFSKYRP